MKVSRDRFEELISLYLDNEASDAELRTLSECVKSDPAAAKKFKESVRIHIATCKLYGKKCHLRNLAEISPRPAPVKKSVLAAGLEWTKLAALIMLSFGMLKFTFATNSGSLGESQAQTAVSAPYEKIDSYDINIRKGDNFNMGNACTVIDFSPKGSSYQK